MYQSTKNPAKLGDRIKKAIRGAGLSQKEVAQKIGISENSMSSYIRGRSPRIDVLCAIAELCGVSIDWLLTEKEGQKDPSTPSTTREPGVNYLPSRLTAEEAKLLKLLRENPEMKGILRKYARGKEGLKEAADDLTKLVQHQTVTVDTK